MTDITEEKINKLKQIGLEITSKIQQEYMAVKEESEAEAHKVETAVRLLSDLNKQLKG